MCPVLDDVAPFYSENAIGLSNRGQSVSDKKNCAAHGDLFHVLLDDALALIVERAGGFVEDQNTWIGNEGAGNGNPLTLTA